MTIHAEACLRRITSHRSGRTGGFCLVIKGIWDQANGKLG
jgi:hypothetical protein